MKYTIVDNVTGKKLWVGAKPSDKTSLAGKPVIEGAPTKGLKFPIWDFANKVWLEDQVALQAHNDDKTNVSTNRSQGKQAFKDFRQLVNSNPTWDQANIDNGMKLLMKALRGLYVRE